MEPLDDTDPLVQDNQPPQAPATDANGQIPVNEQDPAARDDGETLIENDDDIETGTPVTGEPV